MSSIEPSNSKNNIPESERLISEDNNKSLILDKDHQNKRQIVIEDDMAVENGGDKKKYRVTNDQIDGHGGSGKNKGQNAKIANVTCNVLLLDGTEVKLDIPKNSIGLVLFNKVCEHLNLLEKEYFSCTFKHSNDSKIWLANDRLIEKQLQKSKWDFCFEVKFYPQDPCILREEITRYQLYLQIRVDILSGKLPCSFASNSLLGSYACQSQLGDYEPKEHGLGFDYVKTIKFCPHQNDELLERISELHKSHSFVSAAEAEYCYLENVKNMSLYGLHQFPAKDSDNMSVTLGICSSGIIIHNNRIRLHRFIWAKIIKIAYKRNKFFITVRSMEQGKPNPIVKYKFPNYNAAKRTWKLAVEHHAFFRLRDPVPSPRGVFMRKGPKFFSGVTQFQAGKAAEQIKRESQMFNRVYYTMGRGDLAGGKLDTGALMSGTSTVDRTEQTMSVDFSTVTLDRTKRNRNNTSVNDINGVDSNNQMIPVYDAEGNVTYVRRANPSVGSSNEVFMNLQGRDNQRVTMNLGSNADHQGMTYSKTPYPTGPGYLTPGTGPALNGSTPGYNILNNNFAMNNVEYNAGYNTMNTPVGYNNVNNMGYGTGFGAPRSPSYGLDDHDKQYNSGGREPDTSDAYMNPNGQIGYKSINMGALTPGSQGSYNTQRRSNNFMPNDESSFSNQDDHIKQNMMKATNLGIGDKWDNNQSNIQTKTMTRTYTEPDGTVITETRIEKNGVIETHIEKRRFNEDTEDDYDKMLSDAILSVTDMNTDLSVEKIEITKAD